MSGLCVVEFCRPLVAKKINNCSFKWASNAWIQYAEETPTHTNTHSVDATHQAASVDTHRSGLLVAGCAVEHSAKVVVEVVTQSQAAQFTGVRACAGEIIRYDYGNKRRREVEEQKHGGGEEREPGESREGVEVQTSQVRRENF